jgi:hypothetical protein
MRQHRIGVVKVGLPDEGLEPGDEVVIISDVTGEGNPGYIVFWHGKFVPIPAHAVEVRVSGKE